MIFTKAPANLTKTFYIFLHIMKEIHFFLLLIIANIPAPTAIIPANRAKTTAIMMLTLIL